MIKGGWLSTLAGLVMAGFFLALAAWPVFLVGRLTHRVVRAKAWVEVPARVISVQVDFQRRPRRMGHYNVDLLYGYEREGKTFQGRRLAFTPQSNDRGDVWNGRWLKRTVEELDEARRDGRPVTVFVDPGNPSDSVVHRGMMWGDFGMCCGLMLVFALFPIGVIEVLLYNKASEQGRRWVRGLIFSVFLLFALAEVARVLWAARV